MFTNLHNQSNITTFKVRSGTGAPAASGLGTLKVLRCVRYAAYVPYTCVPAYRLCAPISYFASKLFLIAWCTSWLFFYFIFSCNLKPKVVCLYCMKKMPFEWGTLPAKKAKWFANHLFYLPVFVPLLIHIHAFGSQHDDPDHPLLCHHHPRPGADLLRWELGATCFGPAGKLEGLFCVCLNKTAASGKDPTQGFQILFVFRSFKCFVLF